jgi:hypothetical protein
MGNFDRKTQCLGQYISKFPVPLPNNRKTQCLGQCISKFPIPQPSNIYTQCMGHYISNFPIPHMYWPKHLVFLLFGRGWKTWIYIDPNIEFFNCSVGGWGTSICGLCIFKFPIPYREIEKLIAWVNTYPSSRYPYRTIEKLNVYVNTYPSSPSPYRTIVGNLDMYWSKHSVFQLFSTGWGT